MKNVVDVLSSIVVRLKQFIELRVSFLKCKKKTIVIISVGLHVLDSSFKCLLLNAELLWTILDCNLDI